MDRTTRFCCVTLLLALTLSGCAIYEEGTYAPPQAEKATPIAEAESTYTLTHEIKVEDELVGYLLTYLEVAPSSVEPQYFPVGTRFIKNLAFKNLGFITPLGQTYRFGNAEDPEPVGQGETIKMLAMFFNHPEKKLKLIELRP